MRKLIAVALAAILFLAAGTAVAEEETPKTWDELYEEGCRAFREGDTDKARAAFEASGKEAGDAEIVPALMLHACAVPRGQGGAFSVSLPELENEIREVEEMIRDIEDLFARKKISKKAREQYLQMAQDVREYMADYYAALQAADEQARAAADSLQAEPMAAAQGGAPAQGEQFSPLPAVSLREQLTKPKAPGSYRGKAASTQQDGSHTVYLDKDGHVLRREWEEVSGDMTIHGVQHFVNDENGHPVSAFTYWNNVLICSFSFYRLNGSYVSARWFDEAAIRKVFSKGGHR